MKCSLRRAMRRAWGVLVVVSGAVVLGACGDEGPSQAAVGACNIFSSRWSEGPAADRRGDVISAMSENVQSATEQSLKNAFEALTAAEDESDAAWQLAGDDLLETCTSIGWDYPEG